MIGIDLWFSKNDAQTRSINLTSGFIRSKVSDPTPELLIQKLGMDSGNLCSNKLSRLLPGDCTNQAYLLSLERGTEHMTAYRVNKICIHVAEKDGENS